VPTKKKTSNCYSTRLRPEGTCWYAGTWEDVVTNQYCICNIYTSIYLPIYVREQLALKVRTSTLRGCPLLARWRGKVTSNPLPAGLSLHSHVLWSPGCQTLTHITHTQLDTLSIPRHTPPPSPPLSPPPSPTQSAWLPGKSAPNATAPAAALSIASIDASDPNFNEGLLIDELR
jgi:hypothetical protein